jgi:hypothetical protein
MRYASLIALAATAVLFAACRPGGTPATGDGSGSGEGSAEAPGEGSDTAATVEDAAPVVVAAEQTCSADADCRVWQPSDWSADVECCYEYPCTLDYVALNRATWDTLRTWQRAHTFDCTAHLRENGPCDNRPMRCGLSQEPPPAACRDGLCTVAFAEAWPVPDVDAQTCSMASDCTAIRPSSGSLRARCCGADCGTDWIAVNRGTADELATFRAANPPDCDAFTDGNPCPPSVDCPAIVPPTRCEAGMCRLTQP